MEALGGNALALILQSSFAQYDLFALEIGSIQGASFGGCWMGKGYLGPHFCRREAEAKSSTPAENSLKPPLKVSAALGPNGRNNLFDASHGPKVYLRELTQKISLVVVRVIPFFCVFASLFYLFSLFPLLLSRLIHEPV